MNQQAKLRLCVLAVAVATTAVFAGTYATQHETTPQFHAQAAEEGTVVTIENETVVTPLQESAPASEPGQIAPTLVPAQPAAPAPVASPATAAAPEPHITVVEQRLTADERIQREVMDVLARNDTLTGKVGVESRDRIVTLTGYLMTSGQVMRAGRDAGRVMDVRYVVNEIRPRVGVVTY